MVLSDLNLDDLGRLLEGLEPVALDAVALDGDESLRSGKGIPDEEARSLSDPVLLFLGLDVEAVPRGFFPEHLTLPRGPPAGRDLVRTALRVHDRGRELIVTGLLRSEPAARGLGARDHGAGSDVDPLVVVLRDVRVSRALHPRSRGLAVLDAEGDIGATRHLVRGVDDDRLDLRRLSRLQQPALLPDANEPVSAQALGGGAAR